ncbi:putative Ecp2 effector protein domain-containing protein [Seiridium cardinale]|uniref:Ecp2 effector protein domain-containing protein n=1 Tax=Seiridium cardinale TaxID=138064 RepID=A0ABR2XJQ3_9PEZI
MRSSRSFWTIVLLSLETAALSINLRAVAPGTAGPISPYADNYTTLASGVRIYGIPDLPATSQAQGDNHNQRTRRDSHLLSIAGGSSSSLATPRAAAGWCTSSSIENQGSDNSPLISDCQTIATQVYALAGDDNAYFGRSECDPDTSGQFTCYFPVVSYETCMFGVSTIDTGINVSVRIGWQDVGDLITSSIGQCGNSPSDGKVGTSGEMTCPEEISAVLTFLTAWGLYHS